MCEIHDTVQAGWIIIITGTISGSPIKFEPICGLKLNSFEVKFRFLSAVCLLLHQVFSHQRLVTVRSVFSCYKYDLSSSFQHNTWESQRGYFTASHHVYTKGTKGLLSRVQLAVVCQNKAVMWSLRGHAAVSEPLLRRKQQQPPQVGSETPESHSEDEDSLFTDESQRWISVSNRMMHVRRRTGDSMISQSETWQRKMFSDSTLTEEKHHSILQRLEPPSGLIFVEKHYVNTVTSCWITCVSRFYTHLWSPCSWRSWKGTNWDILTFRDIFDSNCYMTVKMNELNMNEWNMIITLVRESRWEQRKYPKDSVTADQQRSAFETL